MLTWDGWYGEDDKFDQPKYLEWESILVGGRFTQQIQLNFPVLKCKYIYQGSAVSTGLARQKPSLKKNQKTQFKKPHLKWTFLSFIVLFFLKFL